MKRKLVMREVAPPRRELTPADYAEELDRERGRIIESWQKKLDDGRAAVAEMAARIMRAPGSLAHAVRWADSIEQDILAEFAKEALGYVEQFSVEEILQYQLNAIDGRQRNNTLRGGSSSDFSNAIEAARREVDRRYGESCRRSLDYLVRLRANAEVL